MSVYLKRSASFSAAHNYWLPELSEADNRERFGKWSSYEGHGHNYRVEVTVAGNVDPVTGMVVNISDVSLALKKYVLDVLDGKFLNREVEYFKMNPPTVENIGRWVAGAVDPHLPENGKLRQVKLWEMETLWSCINIKNTGTMSTSLTRAYDFSASHRLHSKQLSDEENRTLFGKCNNPNGHGHNYGIEVTISGEPDPLTGMIYSLEELDRIVEEEVLLPFDHKYLNLDVEDFAYVNPTSEMLSVVIWHRLSKRLPTTGDLRMSSVVVTETARNSFEYRGDDDC
jgi:6-pyruvoyltetrahydropterin/6-carboxytetrahydropterin synthase